MPRSRQRIDRKLFKIQRNDGSAYFQVDFRTQRGRRIRRFAGTGAHQSQALKRAVRMLDGLDSAGTRLPDRAVISIDGGRRKPQPAKQFRVGRLAGTEAKQGIAKRVTASARGSSAALAGHRQRCQDRVPSGVGPAGAHWRFLGAGCSAES